MEKLSKACIGKRGRWIFKRETRVDCFSLQIDGFTRSEVGENRVERPLFMSVFDTKEEAESFVRVLGGQVIKDRESITIFKPALVTFLQFPIPKNLVQSSFFAGDSEEVFMVSEATISFDVLNTFNIPTGKYEVRGIDLTKISIEELLKVFESENINPITVMFRRKFLTFSQVTSRILGYEASK